MRKTAFFLLFAGMSVITLAQTTPDTLVYTKATDGSSYKIFPSAKGMQLKTGDFMEMNVSAIYKDSLLFSTHEEGMPQYGLYDTAGFPAPFKEVFNNIHVGDSIILRMPTDSILSKGQAPPFMQNGGYIYQYYVITNIYNTKEQVDSAQETHAAVAIAIAEKKQQAQLAQLLTDNKDLIEKDSKTIEAYLAKNKMKAIKGQLGTYLVITKKGTGPKLAPGYQVAVNYTGRSLSNKKVFDSNTDPKFKHVEPYKVDMQPASGVILGWTDALAEMQKGTKATIYVPSTLGFGREGRMPDINPDEILIFDMEVKDARSREEAIAQAAQTETGTEVVVPSKTAAPKKTKPAVKSKTVKPVSKAKPAIKKTGK